MENGDPAQVPQSDRRAVPEASRAYFVRPTTLAVFCPLKIDLERAEPYPTEDAAQAALVAKAAEARVSFDLAYPSAIPTIGVSLIELKAPERVPVFKAFDVTLAPLKTPWVPDRVICHTAPAKTEANEIPSDWTALEVEDGPWDEEVRLKGTNPLPLDWPEAELKDVAPNLEWRPVPRLRSEGASVAFARGTRKGGTTSCLGVLWDADQCGCEDPLPSAVSRAIKEAMAPTDIAVLLIAERAKGLDQWLEVLWEKP